jgi:hypothetical protein
MTLDDEMFAVGLIHNVVPASDYLGEDHCLAHCREFGQPTMFDRQRAEESCVSLGCLGDRPCSKMLALMETPRLGPLPEAVKQDIERITG